MNVSQRDSCRCIPYRRPSFLEIKSMNDLYSRVLYVRYISNVINRTIEHLLPCAIHLNVLWMLWFLHTNKEHAVNEADARMFAQKYFLDDSADGWSLFPILQKYYKKRLLERIDA